MSPSTQPLSNKRPRLAFALALVLSLLVIAFWNATRLQARFEMLSEPHRSIAIESLSWISFASWRAPLDRVQKALHEEEETAAPAKPPSALKPVTPSDKTGLPLDHASHQHSKTLSEESTFIKPQGEAVPIPVTDLALNALPKLTLSAVPPLEGIVIFAGDSLSMGYGASAQWGLPPKSVVSVMSVGKISTGLTATSYYDWPSRITALCESQAPAAFVLSFGANDLIDLKDAQGHYLRFGSAAWSEAYEARALHTVELAKSCGAKVAWMKLPPMREASYEAKIKQLRLAQEAACKASDACVEPFSGLGKAESLFVEQLTLNNKSHLLRAGDGIHMAPYGYKLASDRALSLLGFQADLVKTQAALLPPAKASP